MALTEHNDVEQGETWRPIPGFQAEVREIRARHQDGESQPDLAARFRISTSQVSNIVRFASWAHLESEAV